LRKRILVLLSGMVLAGCAHSTESMMLTDDTALISATGRDRNDEGKVVDATLREAAKLTRQHGYNYFVILSAADASRVGNTIVPNGRLQNQPATDSTYGTSTLSRSFRVGAATFVGRRTSYYKPGLDITIRMYRPGDIDPQRAGVWTTEVILQDTAAAH
jgi:hypothetical protein